MRASHARKTCLRVIEGALVRNPLAVLAQVPAVHEAVDTLGSELSGLVALTERLRWLLRGRS